MARGSRGFERPPIWAIIIMVVGLAWIAVGLSVTSHRGEASASEIAKANTEVAQAPIVAFLGDSYTAGEGATGTARRWTTLVSQAMGWRELNFGQGGTGYTNPGTIAGRQPYPLRVPSIVARNPDIVVVAGGQNDLSTDAATEAAAVARTFADLRAGLPKARIIAVGPSVPSPNVGANARALDAAVQKAATDVGASYLSLLSPNPFAAAGRLAGDGEHPNDAGHQAIADQVLAVLKSGH